jgi:uncharacterized Zn finger protein
MTMEDLPRFTRAVGLDLRSLQEDFSQDELDLAMQVAQGFFRADEVRKSLEKGRDLLRQGEDKRRWFIANDGQTVRVMPASGKAAKSYQVQGTTCTCRDHFIRSPLHGGICKHVALRLLLVLCQLGAGLNALLSEAEEDAEEDAEDPLFTEIRVALEDGNYARADALAEDHHDPDGVRLFIEAYKDLAPAA